MVSVGPAASKEFKAEGSWPRLDLFLAEFKTGLSRSQLHRLIVNGSVLVNGARAKPSQGPADALARGARGVNPGGPLGT